MATFTFVLLGSCLALACFYYLWSRRRFYKVAWQLPGPLGLPFMGLALNMRNPEIFLFYSFIFHSIIFPRVSTAFLQYMARTAEKYNSAFISWLGTNCFLYFNEPETVETIFQWKLLATDYSLEVRPV